MTAPRASWERLGAVAANALVEDRLILHRVVQLLASFGQTCVEAREDDSHRSMLWDDGTRAFVSLASADDLSAAVSFEHLGLELRRGRETLTRFDLHGRTAREARDWLGAAVGAARGDGAVDLAWPEYALPPAMPHVDDPLRPSAEGPAELSRWFQAGHGSLSSLAAQRPEASPVRCWPHHFDIATLLTFPATEGTDGEEARYVGVGLSPGDEGFDEPYVYVNGWPAPEPADLPPLRTPGRWNTRGWVGAVLVGSEITASVSPDAQRSAVDDFIDRGVRAMVAAVSAA